MPRYPLVCRLPLVVFVLLFASAVSRGQPATLLIQRGEELYRNDRLLDAEKQFTLALKTAALAEQPHCYDRLLAIYIRLGRLDRAVQLAGQYENWLTANRQKDRLRMLWFEQGWCYFTLGHHASAETFLWKALDAPALPPLPPDKRLSALLYLAQTAELVGDRAKTARGWAEVEAFALERLNRGAEKMPLADQAECVWRLADSYAYQRKHEPAIARLTQLLTQPLDLPARRVTLQHLAKHHAQRSDYKNAEKVLRDALESYENTADGDRLTLGDLAAHLAEVLKRQSRFKEAEEWRTKAADAYQAVLQAPQLGQPYMAGTMEAFWKLQLLHQNATQFQKALHLMAAQEEQWPDHVLIDPKLAVEGGRLELALGAFRRAKELLRKSVGQMEEQTPPNLRELPRAYLNLGVVELMTEAIDAAERLGKKSLDLYQRYKLPEDPILVDVYNLLGTCAAQNGNYAEAIGHYRKGLARCEQFGPEAAPQQCSLLLNIALLHKSQGDLPQAFRHCADALKVYQGYADPDALGLAVFDAAIINMRLTQGKIADAVARAEPILRLCKKHDVKGGPLLMTALHCQAVHALSKRDFVAADRLWNEVLTLQGREAQAVFMPRTLSYLGISAELQGKPAEAEAYLRRARALQETNPHAFPATQFITLWRLAELTDQAGRRPEARKLLEEALRLVERARFQTYGDSQSRAAFFAQFTPGFDRYVEWCVRDGDLDAALAANLRGRSRSLLEQLQLAGVDPRQGLTGPDGEKLLKTEADLRKQVAALRAKAWGMAGDAADAASIKQHLKALEAARQHYADVWREILNASPTYRGLSDARLGDDALPRLRTTLRDAGTVMLVYHVGRDRSFVFVVGRTVQAVELVVPEDVAADAAPPPTPKTEDAIAGVRGLALKYAPPPAGPPLTAEEARQVRRVPLGHYAARALVDTYRLVIADPDFAPTRGLALKSHAPARPLRPQRGDLLGEVLLPPPVRAMIRFENPREVLVIPDGPLHKLPLEAVVLATGENPKYVLDELPPLIYAPSLAVARLLVERARRQDDTPLSLLTVANPKYPEEAGPGTARNESPFRGLLPPLPFTAVESQKIRKAFAPEQAAALEGPAATEKGVVARLDGKRIVHLAAHGFADDRFGNLFGALALTPGDPADSADDGFLSLHEIYTLPLKECELAVLSACVTNVGPQAPLEAGVTLASGFLSAGARRVVASHWSVDDAATAELMDRFFAQVTAAARDGQPPPYAQALQEGRLHLRRQPRTATPFYWAPFVLIGPPSAKGS